MQIDDSDELKWRSLIEVMGIDSNVLKRRWFLSKCISNLPCWVDLFTSLWHEMNAAGLNL